MSVRLSDCVGVGVFTRWLALRELLAPPKGAKSIYVYAVAARRVAWAGVAWTNALVNPDEPSSSEPSDQQKNQAQGLTQSVGW